MQVAAAACIVSLAYVGALEKVTSRVSLSPPTEFRFPFQPNSSSSRPPQCVLATSNGDFFTANCSNGLAVFDIAGSIEVPVIACQWADDGDVCAVATGVPSLVMLTKEFDVVGECEDG